MLPIRIFNLTLKGTKTYLFGFLHSSKCRRKVDFPFGRGSWTCKATPQPENPGSPLLTKCRNGLQVQAPLQQGHLAEESTGE